MGRANREGLPLRPGAATRSCASSRSTRSPEIGRRTGMALAATVTAKVVLCAGHFLHAFTFMLHPTFGRSPLRPSNSFKPNPLRGSAVSGVRHQTDIPQLETHSMKAYGFSLAAFLLVACTTTGTPSSGAPPTSSDYAAKRQTDGSIEIVVTGIADMPKSSSEARLELGPMLDAAAAKECPAGFELIQDKVPTVRTDSGKLVGILRGVARCK